METEIADGISFVWEINVGQLVSTTLLMLAIAGVYAFVSARYARVYRRVDVLEAKLTMIREEMDRLVADVKHPRAEP